MLKKTINSWAQFGAIYKLFTKYYLKSFFGPFFNLIFTVVIYAILGALMDYERMLPGILAMIAVATGVQLIPFCILGLKKSVLMKRIGASPVKPLMFTMVLLIFFFSTILISSIWLILWSMILTRDIRAVESLGDGINSLYFIYGMLLNIILSIALGFSISSVAKTEMQAQTLGMIIYFPIAFLSGQFISADVIAESDVMSWISRFIPFRYTTMIINQSMSGDDGSGYHELTKLGFSFSNNTNPFAIQDFRIFKPAPTFDQLLKIANDKSELLKTLDSFKLTIYDKADHIISFIYPYIGIVGFVGFSIKKFSWSAGR